VELHRYFSTPNACSHPGRPKYQCLGRCCAISGHPKGAESPRPCATDNITPMDILRYVVVAVVVVVVIIGVVRGGRIQEQRRAHLKQWADQRGWSYAADDSQLTRQWQEYPVRGGGRAAQVLRGSVAEGEIVSFTNSHVQAGSTTVRLYLVTALNVGTLLPTVVAAPPSVDVPEPRPAVHVNFTDPQFRWALYTHTEKEAAEARRLFTPSVRTRLTAAAAAESRLRLTLEGQHILVITPGSQKVNRLEKSVALVRELARQMRVRPNPGA